MTWLRVFLLLFLGVINLVIFGRMLWGSTGLIEYMALKNQYAQLREKAASLDAQNLALSRSIRLVKSDNQYMEKMIRQRLHYLRDNEILYLFGSAEQKRPGASPNDRKN